MASNAYTVAQRGDKFRVVKGGSPAESIDNGGFKDRQSALDAAMKANRKDKKLGTGGAEQARTKIANRRNKIESALGKATGN